MTFSPVKKEYKLIPQDQNYYLHISYLAVINQMIQLKPIRQNRKKKKLNTWAITAPRISGMRVQFIKRIRSCKFSCVSVGNKWIHLLELVIMPQPAACDHGLLG